MNAPGSLTHRLRAVGAPFITAQLRHPTVQALQGGQLEKVLARSWLEQDYLFLHDEIRFLTRLTWQAPDENQRAELLRLAWNVLNEEIASHRDMSSPFQPDFENAVMGPVTSSYTRWLLDSAADYGLGLTALYAGLWGYSTLGQRLAVPAEPPFRRWVESYQDADFVALAERVGDMVDESAPDPDRALATFLTGMAHEIAFWDPPGTP